MYAYITYPILILITYDIVTEYINEVSTTNYGIYIYIYIYIYILL